MSTFFKYNRQGLDSFLLIDDNNFIVDGKIANTDNLFDALDCAIKTDKIGFEKFLDANNIDMTEQLYKTISNDIPNIIDSWDGKPELSVIQSSLKNSIKRATPDFFEEYFKDFQDQFLTENYINGNNIYNLDEKFAEYEANKNSLNSNKEQVLNSDNVLEVDSKENINENDLVSNNESKEVEPSLTDDSFNNNLPVVSEKFNTVLGHDFSEDEFNKILNGAWSDLQEFKHPNSNETFKGKIKMFKDGEDVSFNIVTQKEKFDNKEHNFSDKEYQAVLNNEYITKTDSLNNSTFFGKFDNETKDVLYNTAEELNLPTRIGKAKLTNDLKLKLLNEGKIDNFKFTHLNNDFEVTLKLDKGNIEFDNVQVKFMRNAKEFENLQGLSVENTVAYTKSFKDDINKAIQDKDFDKMKSFSIDNDFKASDKFLKENLLANKDYSDLEYIKAMACLGVNADDFSEKLNSLKNDMKEKDNSELSLEDKLTQNKLEKDKEKAKQYSKDVIGQSASLMKDL